jgi:hypothetical protein
MMATLNGEIVLFGGLHNGAYINDTWTWDGATWTQHAVSGPPASEWVVGATLGRSVMMYNAEGETWTWDGTSWTQLQAPGPSAIARQGVATFANTVVLFGGIVPGVKPSNETWLWDGATWTQHDVAGPSARFGPTMSGQ